MFELPALDLRKCWKPMQTLTGAARRWAHAHRIFHMDALGLIMGLVGSSGLRIVAAGSARGSCTINANGAVYAICTITHVNYEVGTSVTTAAMLYAYAITSSSASIIIQTGRSTGQEYTLQLTSSNISVTASDTNTYYNITAIGLA